MNHDELQALRDLAARKGYGFQVVTGPRPGEPGEPTVQLTSHNLNLTKYDMHSDKPVDIPGLPGTPDQIRNALEVLPDAEEPYNPRHPLLDAES